ncbi:hypothetical protein C2E20_5749 [Micractinium conductrix]|uniref:Uncharacterized protein n=1 Tax=Micractinium conductrix TaxID=554055 RepID=A0A2P6VA58_9CHLO|nr:hypothetical protein C2E20_5749 [Micractinium conductrix]|eukprot:PSC70965.1 hypothetical protein C2E20_5749 [Micractinium conductrix]
MKQIELGRIQLPEEPELGDGGCGAASPAGTAPPAPDAVDRQLAWLLAAHRGAGRQAPAGIACSSDSGASSGGVSPAAAAAGGGSEAGGDIDEGAVREQMAGISRCLWSAVSSGTASGVNTVPTSASRTAHAYSEAAVAAMQADGELAVTHHRRRDEHSRYVEASARAAAMRRGVVDPKP